MPNIQVDDFLTPSSKQRYDRKKQLCRLIDLLGQTNIGKHVINMMPLNMTIVSCELKKKAQTYSVCL